jgi:hypothetical protein
MLRLSERLYVRTLAVTVYLFAVTAHAQTQNSSFETPNLGQGNFAYAPTGAAWTFGAGAGISNIGSGFTASAPEVPAGKQVAFIQTTGSIAQSVYLVPGTILSFHATQRINFQQGPQSIKVLVNNVAQAFHLGSQSGQQTVYSITPPKNYYGTFAVNLASVNTPNYYSLKVVGTASGIDATAFIDSLTISTPTSHAYGLWDSGLTAATWRSDLPVSTRRIQL